MKTFAPKGESIYAQGSKPTGIGKIVATARKSITPARRFVTYRPMDGKFTARGTACLPPEGRHVYRPRDGMFTARGAVSNESAGKSDGEAGKVTETKEKTWLSAKFL